jgi:hypothetical protein
MTTITPEAFATQGWVNLQNLKEKTGSRKIAEKTIQQWKDNGYIIPLANGIFTLNDNLAKPPLSPERMANIINPDSYVTGLWMLSIHSIIPEGVTEVTCATTQATEKKQTPQGTFGFQHFDPKEYFGWTTETDGYGQPIRIATPEKALLDFIWTENKKWTPKEFAQWGISDPRKKINIETLQKTAATWGNTKISQTTENLISFLRIQT